MLTHNLLLSAPPSKCDIHLKLLYNVFDFPPTITSARRGSRRLLSARRRTRSGGPRLCADRSARRDRVTSRSPSVHATGRPVSILMLFAKKEGHLFGYPSFFARARDGTRIYLLPEAPCFQGVQAHLIVGNQKGNQRSWDMFNIQITLPSLQSVLIAVNFSFSILTL